MKRVSTKTKVARSSSAGNSAWPVRPGKGVQVLEAPAFSRLDWLVHGFSARPGGTSELPSTTGARGPANVLNLGFTDWDDRARVEENRLKFAAAIHAGKMQMVTLRQIHSDLVHPIGGKHPLGVCQGDALITGVPGLLLAVQTADCIPLLLADTRNHAVAAVHSGWRGTAKRIAEKTLGRMRMEFGTRPEHVIAALGPGIGRCCYEVGQDVAKEFAAQFPSAKDWFEGPFDRAAGDENDPNWLPWLTMAPPGHAPEPPRLHLDLVAANRAILIDSGVPSGRIFDSGLCTSCRTDLFFSYRKERKTGRQMAVIGIL